MRAEENKWRATRAGAAARRVACIREQHARSEKRSARVPPGGHAVVGVDLWGQRGQEGVTAATGAWREPEVEARVSIEAGKGGRAH